MNFCKACKANFPGLSARCPHCGAWDVQINKASIGQISSIVPISRVKKREVDRNSTGFEEFDRVLGGGLVPGASILLAGAPGSGKSTLALQAASYIHKGADPSVTPSPLFDEGEDEGEGDFFDPDEDEEEDKEEDEEGEDAGVSGAVIYFAGEESKEQIRARHERIGGGGDILLSSEIRISRIRRIISHYRPCVAICDSLQTLKAGDSSLLDELALLIRACKAQGTTLILIGQLVKDNTIAGPRAIEHAVDAALYLDVGRSDQIRYLSAHKNRDGSADEIGLFRMGGGGLVDYTPRIDIRQEIGAAHGVLKFGRRYFIAEIQALFGEKGDRIVTDGLDRQRVEILRAVVRQALRVALDAPLFLALSDDLDSADRGLDLALCVAIVSALLDKAPPSVVFVGEVSLSGRILPLHDQASRIDFIRRAGSLPPYTCENAPTIKDLFYDIGFLK